MVVRGHRDIQMPSIFGLVVIAVAHEGALPVVMEVGI